MQARQVLCTVDVLHSHLECWLAQLCVPVTMIVQFWLDSSMSLYEGQLVYDLVSSLLYDPVCCNVCSVHTAASS